MTDRIYYKVPSGTKTHQHIVDFLSSETKAHESWKEFAIEQGADPSGIWETGGSLRAIRFKNFKNEDHEKLWRVEYKIARDAYVPSGRSKEAKALRKTINKLPSVMGWWEWNNFFGKTILSGGRIPNTTLDCLKDGTNIVGIPYRENMPEITEELEEISTRQYYELTGNKQ